MREKIKSSILGKLVVFLLPLLILLVASILFIINNFSRRHLQDDLRMESHENATLIENITIQLEQSALQSAILISDMDIAKKAYLMSDERAAADYLQKSIRPMIERIKSANSYDNFRVHFHKPPARSFLRIWTEQRFDTLLSFRHTIQEINRTHRPVSGIELGRGGFAIRGIAPIFSDAGDYLGSVEVFYCMFDMINIMDLGESNQFPILLTRADHAEKLFFDDEAEKYFQGRIGNFYIADIDSGRSEYFDLVDGAMLDRAVETDSLMVEFKGDIAVGYIPIRGYSGETIGVLVNVSDYTRMTSLKQYANMYLYLIIMSLTFLMGAVVYIWFRRNIERPLKELADAAGQLTGGRMDFARASEISARLYGDIRTVRTDGVPNNEIVRLFVDFQKMITTLGGVFNNVSDGIVIHDSEGNIIDVNHSFLRMTEIDRDEAINSKIYDLIGINIKREKFAEMWARALSGENINCECSGLRRHSGSEFIAEAGIGMLELVDTSLLIVNVKDITSRKIYEQTILRNEQQLKKILGASPTAIAIASTSTDLIRYANTKANELLNIKPGNYEKLLADSLGFSKSRRQEILREIDMNGAINDIEIHVENDPGCWLLISAIIIDYGSEECIFVAMADITGRKQTENRLRESEELHRSLINTSPDAIVVSSASARITFASPRTVELFGYSSRYELLDKRLVELMTESDRKRAFENIQQIFAGRPSTDNRYEMIRRSGEIFTAEINSSAFKDSEGNTTGMISVIRDVSSRIEMEEAIRISEQKYYKLFEESIESIFVTDSETGVLVDCNQEACRLLDLPKSRIIGRHESDFHIAPNDKNGFTPEFLRHAREQTRDTIETTITTGSGDTKDVVIKANLIEVGGRRHLMGMMRDITESRRAEHELRLKARLLDEANDSIFVHDMQGNFIYINETAWRRRGYTYEEMMAMNLSQLDQPEYAEKIPAALELLMSRGQATFESAHICKDGSIMEIEIHSSMVEFEGQQVVLSIVRDVTERREMESALRKSEERYQMLFEQATEGIFVTNSSGDFIQVNPAACELMGHSPAEFGKMNIKDILFEKDFARFGEEFDKCLRGDTVYGEWSLRTRSGDKVIADLSSKLLPDGRMLAFVRDITVRREIEDSLRESENRFRKLTESTSAAIFIYSGNRILYTNSASEQLSGFSRDELAAMSLADLVRDSDIELIQKIYENHQPEITQISTLETQIRRKDG
ncbi:MAG: PAS domain S-box protein, partial [Candidatus Kapaibacterium sp.]